MRGKRKVNASVLPAPVGGWNARDSYQTMPATDAVKLENLYPGTTSVSLRRGETDWATGLGAQVKTLMSFSGFTTSKLFASTNSGVYDISSGGAIGATVASLTEGYVSHVNLNTLGGNYLYLCNGVDKPLLYDGATWTAIDSVSTPAITGVTSTLLSHITVFKRRVWFVEKGSMSLWYLPVGQLGGAAVEFDVGQLFKRGGTVVASTAWTVDGGEGLDDYFVIATSQGELAVYKGTDPASASTFTLVGVFYIGEPLNNRCFTAYGGDLLFLSKLGVYPMSKVLSASPTLKGLNLDDKIGPAFQAAVEAGGSLPGWMMCAYPTVGALLVNVPVVADTRWDQYVLNLSTGAWCSFVGWNGQCLAVHAGNLYLGKNGTVTKIWVGDSDLNGNLITGTAYQAFNSFNGFGSNKLVTLMKPFLRVSGNFYVSVGTSVDYDLDDEFSLELVSINGGGVWDTSLWDSGVFDTEGISWQNWFTPSYKLGQAVSVKMQFSANVAGVAWNATEVLYQNGGLL